MTEVLVSPARLAACDPLLLVQADLRAIADQMQRCGQRRNRQAMLHQRLQAHLVFVRQHCVTAVVLSVVCASVALAL